MKILCNYNLHKHYGEKPTSEIVRQQVQKELSKPALIEVEDLANSLVNGCNCRPCAINGTKKEGFISQQLFLIDIDNTDELHKPLPKSERVSLPASINKAMEKGIKPCFAYYTFSNTEEIPKYRIAFLFDEAITDWDERDAMQQYIGNAFENNFDKKTMDKSRIFFGSMSGNLAFADFSAINSASNILSKEEVQSTVKELKKANNKEKRVPKCNGKHKVASGRSNIDAIARHDVDFLRNRLGNKKKSVFDNRKDFFDYLYKTIDLAELLEVEPKKNFSCILPSHEDSNPSANVFREKFGTWKYKCFGCGALLNTKQIFEVLGNFDSEYKVIEFIKAVYNLEIKTTEWSQEQIENIDRILDCLSRCDEEGFSFLCPTASINTRNARNIFVQILILAKNTIYPERTADNGNIIFYMSIRQIAKAAEKSSIDKVAKYLKMLIYHKMLEIVPDEEVPKQFLYKAIKQREEVNYKHTNFYCIPSWVYKRIQTIEAQGKKWKENNYRLKGISYEMFYRAEGYEVASELYPQYSKIHTNSGNSLNRKTTVKSDMFHHELMEIIVTLIQEKGFCTEAEVIEESKKLGFYEKSTDIQIKRSITDIMNSNCLKKARANNDLKARFGIKADRYSHPMIIFQD